MNWAHNLPRKWNRTAFNKLNSWQLCSIYATRY